MDVAQLVELLVVVQAVAGSNPVVHPRETALWRSFRRLADGKAAPRGDLLEGRNDLGVKLRAGAAA